MSNRVESEQAFKIRFDSILLNEYWDFMKLKPEDEAYDQSKRNVLEERVLKHLVKEFNLRNIEVNKYDATDLVGKN